VKVPGVDLFAQIMANTRPSRADGPPAKNRGQQLLAELVADGGRVEALAQWSALPRRAQIEEWLAHALKARDARQVERYRRQIAVVVALEADNLAPDMSDDEVLGVVNDQPGSTGLHGHAKPIDYIAAARQVAPVEKWSRIRWIRFRLQHALPLPGVTEAQLAESVNHNAAPAKQWTDEEIEAVIAIETPDEAPVDEQKKPAKSDDDDPPMLGSAVFYGPSPF